MPDAVARRLEEVVAAESADRAHASDGSAVGNGQSASRREPRVTLGTFGTDLDKPRRSRWVIPALAAAAAAAVVGFGAYVVSASAGLNEPPVVAAVDSSDLGAEAIALQRTSGGLSPHRFSQAWGCARQVTAGRITGLVSSSVDGTPALLVYTKSDGSAQVTVVTGCVGGKPSAGPQRSCRADVPVRNSWQAKAVSRIGYSPNGTLTKGTMSSESVRDVIIVGSGPAGYTAAIYAARADLKPLVFESEIDAGGALMTTTEVENFPGFRDAIMGPELMDSMRAQAQRFGAEMVTEDVVEMDLTGDIKIVKDGYGNSFSARTVILAMGSGYRKLGLEGEDRLSGHGVSWCAT